MKYRELIEEAKRELDEEIKATAKEEIKERLAEILETEAVLAEMRKQLEAKLDGDIG